MQNLIKKDIKLLGCHVVAHLGKRGQIKRAKAIMENVAHTLHNVVNGMPHELLREGWYTHAISKFAYHMKVPIALKWITAEQAEEIALKKLKKFAGLKLASTEFYKDFYGLEIATSLRRQAGNLTGENMKQRHKPIRWTKYFGKEITPRQVYFTIVKGAIYSAKQGILTCTQCKRHLALANQCTHLQEFLKKQNCPVDHTWAKAIQDAKKLIALGSDNGKQTAILISRLISVRNELEKEFGTMEDHQGEVLPGAASPNN